MRGSKRDLTGYPLIHLTRGGQGERLTTWSALRGCSVGGDLLPPLGDQSFLILLAGAWPAQALATKSGERN